MLKKLLVEPTECWGRARQATGSGSVTAAVFVLSPCDLFWSYFPLMQLRRVQQVLSTAPPVEGFREENTRRRNVVLVCSFAGPVPWLFLQRIPVAPWSFGPRLENLTLTSTSTLVLTVVPGSARLGSTPAPYDGGSMAARPRKSRKSHPDNIRQSSLNPDVLTPPPVCTMTPCDRLGTLQSMPIQLDRGIHYSNNQRGQVGPSTKGREGG